MHDHRGDVIVIIPALNEERAIASAVAGVLPFVSKVIVVDNGSTDETSARAAAAGAHVVAEEKAGYGRSCLAGMAAGLEANIIVFMDGDGADNPEDLPALIAPIKAGHADFVVGSRLAGAVDDGALTAPQRIGNALAAHLMRVFWGADFTDLGPFRAIKRDALDQLGMSAKTYGWTVEMQVRAAKQGLRSLEVPVVYRRRVGVSKISGTVKGVILAGAHILGVITREVLFDIAAMMGARKKYARYQPQRRTG